MHPVCRGLSKGNLVTSGNSLLNDVNRKVSCHLGVINKHDGVRYLGVSLGHFWARMKARRSVCVCVCMCRGGDLRKGYSSLFFFNDIMSCQSETKSYTITNGVNCQHTSLDKDFPAPPWVIDSWKNGK